MISGGTIMVLGASQAIFFAALIITKKRKTPPDFFLITYLILLVIHLLYYFSMFFFPEKVPDVIGILGFSLVILHTPIFFLYVRSLAIEKIIDGKTILLHTIPYISYNAILLIGLFTGVLELNPKNGFLGITQTDFPIFYQSGQVLALVTAAYIVWGFYLLKAFRRSVSNNQSNLTSYKWLSFLVLSFLFYFISIYLVLSVALDSEALSVNNVFYYVSFIIMAYVFVLGFFGIKQQAIFTDLQFFESKKTVEEKYAKSGLKTESIVHIKSELERIMLEDKLFLNSEISLPFLAEKMNLKAPYLSQVINQQFQLNFYDFINQYRIEEVKSRLNDSNYKHLSLLGIALDCGYKSKSSFNKSFKKHTGTTPTDFKKEFRSSSL
ncbi:helix-turn-helix domain-containing protein [Ekhidna sp.]